MRREIQARFVAISKKANQALAEGKVHCASSFGLMEFSNSYENVVAGCFGKPWKH